MRNCLYPRKLQKVAQTTASAIVLATAAGLLTAAQVNSQEEWPGGYKPITNDQFFGDHETPEMFEFRAEHAYQSKNYDATIYLVRQALAGDDEDIDAHKYLALALEGKMKKQAEKDPSLFEECVKEWLIVMRNERGPEKGLSLKDGRTFGPYSNRFGDEMGTIMARQHLVKLTGHEPKSWQTDKQFIKEVTAPAQERVKGKILNKRNMQEQEGGEFTPQ